MFSTQGGDMFDIISTAGEDLAAPFSGTPTELRWCCVSVGNESQLLDEFVKTRRNDLEQKLPRRLRFYGHVYATTQKGRLTVTGVKDLLNACHMWISCLQSLKTQLEKSRTIVEDTMRLLIHVEVAARYAAIHEHSEFEQICQALIETMKRVQSIQTVTMGTGYKEFRDDFRLHAVLFFWLKSYSIISISHETDASRDYSITTDSVLAIYRSLIMCGLLRISHHFDKSQPIPCECLKQAWTTIFFESDFNFWEYFVLSLDQQRIQNEQDSEHNAYLQIELDLMDTDPVGASVFFDIAIFLISTLIADSNLKSDYITAHEAIAKIIRKIDESDLSRSFYALFKLFHSQPQNCVRGGVYLSVLKESLAKLMKKTPAPIADIPDLACCNCLEGFSAEFRNFLNADFAIPAGLVKPTYAWELQAHLRLLSLICSDEDLWGTHEKDLWAFFKQLMESSTSDEQLNSILLAILSVLQGKKGYFVDNFNGHLKNIFNTANPMRLLSVCCLVSIFTNSSDALYVMKKFSYKVKPHVLPTHLEFFRQQSFQLRSIP